MKKYLEKIIFLLIIVVVFNYKLEVFAAEKVCEITDTNPASAALGGGYVGSTIDFYIKLYRNGEETDEYVFNRTTGYYYTASFGDKTAFCIDSGRRRGVNYVKRYVLDKTQYNAVYEIYNWYQKNSSVSNARKIAQVLIWVAIEEPTLMNDIFELGTLFDRNNPTEFSGVAKGKQADSLVYSLADMFGASDDCYYLSSQIQIGYPWFTCGIRNFSSFTKYCTNSLGEDQEVCEAVERLRVMQSYGPNGRTYAAACSDTTKPTMNKKYEKACDDVHKRANELAAAGGDRYFLSTALENYNFIRNMTTEQYTSWMYSNSVWSGIGTAMSGFKYDDALDIVEGMIKTGPYSGDLYVWCDERDTSDAVENKAYRTYQCFIAPDSSCTSCPTELKELKENYNYDSLSDTQKKNLENDTRWKNALNTLYAKYSYAYLQDYVNPRCSGPVPEDPPPVKPICRPKLDEYACNYSRENGGFYISDAVYSDGSIYEACYIDNNIAFNTDEGLEVESKDTNLSSKYCDVYCWEAFGADFPIGVKNIRAGSTFFWGKDKANGIFGNLNARRICKTVDIDYPAYVTDWNTNEDQIAQAYVDYMAQKEFNNRNDYTSNSCTITESCPGGTSTSYGPAQSACGANDCSKCYNNGSGWVYSETLGTSWCRSTTVCNSCKTGYTDSGGSCVNTNGIQYKRSEQIYNFNGKSGSVAEKTTSCYDSAQSNVDGLLDDSTAESSKLSILNGHMDDRKKIAAEINYCQSQDYINKNNIYSFVGKVTLNYTDPLGIDRDIDNPVALENTSTNNGLNSNGTLNAAQVVTVNCNPTPNVNDASGKCSGTNALFHAYNYTIPKYDEYHWDYWGIYHFKYNQENFAWKVIVETKEVLNYKTANGNIPTDSVVPYDVGYGIPTGFKTATGYYEVSVDVEGFGHNGHFNDLIKEKLNVEVYNYACPYQVENKIYYDECNYECDDNTKTCRLIYNSPADCPGGGGIDLVYRLIEMPNKPAGVANIGTRQKIVFPSIDGDGRAPGDNWATFIGTEPKGFVNITSDGLIYDEDGDVNEYGPIYEIELTPTAISEIRTDTLSYRHEGKDPYTSYTDADGHGKVICEGDTPQERTCASNYITELIQSRIITGGYYVECPQCTNTGTRLDWIDSQKERFYE